MRPVDGGFRQYQRWMKLDIQAGNSLNGLFT